MKAENIRELHFLSLKSGYAGSELSRLFFLLGTIFLIGFSKIQAQQSMDYTVQANIIYRFTKYIDWPDNKKTGDFIIGIIGDSPLSDELKNFVINKTVSGRKIVVKNFSSSSPAYNCHILFVSEDESSNLKKIAERTASNSILIVSESEGLVQKGACINFIIFSDHLKLEISKNNIEHRSLSIASELLQLGIIVK